MSCRGKRFGQRKTYIVEVAPGPWVTADGEPILAVSSYSSPPADGRPLRDVLTIAPNDGTPATYVSFYAQGTLQTPDGRPVYATTAVSGGGASITLNELSLSDNTWTNGSAQTVSVYGTTATSTLSLVSPPSGITINSGARSLTYDGTIAAGSGSVTIRETLAGATNTPRDTVVGYTIAAAAPTLGALGLSSTSYAVGTPSSGTITGATSGSSIALGSAPTGFTIDSGARTWAYDGTGSVTTGSLTLTETLAGATNTPNVSTIGYTVAAASATLDSTLSTPVLIDQTSGGVIAFDAGIQEDYGVDDTVYLIAKNKAGATVLTFSNVIDATEATDSSAGTTGKASFTGLSAVSTATTYRWTVYVEKAGGATYGPSSATVITGPDDLEPALTLPTRTNTGATFVTLGFTSDQAGTRYTVLVPQAEADPTNTQVKAGQKASGAAAPVTSTGAATAGVNTYSQSGTTASTAYKVCTVVEDGAGNLSAVLTDTYTSLASDPSLAVLNTTTGTNKNGNAVVSGSPPLSYAFAAFNDKHGVRSTIQQVSNKAQFEFTVTTGATSNIRVGIEDGTRNLNGTVGSPGFNDSTGLVIEFNLGQYVYLNYNSGANQFAFYPNNVGSVADDDIFTIVYDKTAGTMELWRTRSDVTTQAGSTATGLPSLSAHYAYVGTDNGGTTGTVNFGATAYAKTPGSGVASIWG